MSAAPRARSGRRARRVCRRPRRELRGCACSGGAAARRRPPAGAGLCGGARTHAPLSSRRTRTLLPLLAAACNDATLQAVEVPGKAFKICVDAPPTIAPAAEAAADTTTTTNAKGGNKTAAAADDKAAKRKRRNDKRKKDADAGRQMRGVGCGDPAAGVTCRGRNQCVAGVCLACGGLDQPCCAGKRNACTQYDGQGRVACVDDADAGTKMCRAAPRQS